MFCLRNIKLLTTVQHYLQLNKLDIVDNIVVATKLLVFLACAEPVPQTLGGGGT